ncbi:MAG: discoidin domain-containing protein [Capsulimonadaceae bacterium]|nr:discoidin domain-containing protein [Capsulimonadaceae bacterium]
MRTFHGVIAFLLLLAVIAPLTAAPEPVVPGAVWLDDEGHPIEAHGGGVTRVGDTFYWYGEDRSPGNPAEVRCVSGYSSKDLVHWTHLGQVMKTTIAIVERPKVYFNPKRNTWVMWVHLDGQLPGQPYYSVASVGVFVSGNPAGPFQMIKMFRPLGRESRDIGQFLDDDGAAYLIFEDRPSGFHIARLTDDYEDIATDVSLLPQHLEGGVLAHIDDLYYAGGSHLSSWAPNPNVYATSRSLSGPWSTFENIAPPETNTYMSQSTMLLKVKGANTTALLFMADQWKPRNLSDSRYLWMPLIVDKGKLTLPAPRPWKIDVASGEVSFDVSPQDVKVAEDRRRQDLAAMNASVALPTTATASSFQPGWEASKTVDGTAATFWHTQWSPVRAALPQSITLDLGSVRTLTKLTYVPRQDGHGSGTITKYAVSVSSDGVQFGASIASSYWTGDASVKTAVLPFPTARYVRLEAFEGIDGAASAAEITVFGEAVTTTNGTH